MKILKKAKWKLSHDMEVILADQEKGVQPFVVWVQDPQSKEKFYGHYFDRNSYHQAVRDFEERAFRKK